MAYSPGKKGKARVPSNQEGGAAAPAAVAFTIPLTLATPAHAAYRVACDDRVPDVQILIDSGDTFCHRERGRVFVNLLNVYSAWTGNHAVTVYGWDSAGKRVERYLEAGRGYDEIHLLRPIFSYIQDIEIH